MADNDVIGGLDNLIDTVSGETPAYQYKDPNTDMMKAISKCIDAVTGETGTEYTYKDPNTDVIQKMDELAGAIAESGGGGGGSLIITDLIPEPATASSTEPFTNTQWDANAAAWHAFDKDKTTAWASGNGMAGNWQLGYHFNNPVVVNRIRIVNRTDPTWGVRQAPQVFWIRGSNDGENYTTVVSGGHIWSTTSEEYIFDFENTAAYSYWRLDTKISMDGATGNLSLAILEFFNRSYSSEKIDFTVSLKDSIKEDSYRNPISFTTVSDSNFNDYFVSDNPLTYAIPKKAMNIYFALKCYEFNGRTDSRSDIILYKNSIEIARCHPDAWEKKIEIGLINLNIGDHLTVGYDGDYWHYGSLSLSSNIDNLDTEIYTS